MTDTQKAMMVVWRLEDEFAAAQTHDDFSDPFNLSGVVWDDKIEAAFPAMVALVRIMIDGQEQLWCDEWVGGMMTLAEEAIRALAQLEVDDE